MDVIKLDSISKSYEDELVLEHVSLKVRERERMVVLGPSGCGKTTMLRLIAGFIAPDGGVIRIRGERVSEAGRVLTPPERRNIGMVFQDLALWPHLTVKGNLEFGLKAKRVPKSERQDRIGKALDLVAMARYADKRPGDLSGGQQQRVALARALVLRPAVLLMDEPLSSLESGLSERLRREIVKLQEALGFTLVYVTHDESAAFDMATRVVRMRQGCIDREE